MRQRKAILYWDGIHYSPPVHVHIMTDLIIDDRESICFSFLLSKH